MFPDFFANAPTKADVQTFYSTGGAGPWQTWNKPRGCSMSFIVAVGGGGGGGGGMTGAIGTIRGGGGGGGSGASSRVLIPTFFLPDNIFIRVGLGGQAAAPAAAGNTGGVTYLTAVPINLTTNDIVLQSGAAAATGGAAGSVAGSAAAGAAETICTTALACLTDMGIQQFIAGKIGSIGGVVGGGAGAANTLLGGAPLAGGAGGGTTPAANTEFAGGAQTSSGGRFLTLPGGTAGGNPGHGVGAPPEGRPWVPYGGTGGGTGGAAATVGGNGGNGALGCGGGGGGGGVTGGSGGRGGDGFCMIISW